MKKELIRSKKIGGSYTTTTIHGTKAGGFVFVTGQIGNKPGTAPAKTPHEIVELGSIEEQTIQVMENVKAILEEAAPGEVQQRQRALAVEAELSGKLCRMRRHAASLSQRD